MADNRMFIERRPEGDYAVRKPDFGACERGAADAGRGDRLGATAGRRRFVERVRKTDRGHPDKWRRP